MVRLDLEGAVRDDGGVDKELLVVDDDPLVRSALNRVLRRAHFHVTEAASLHEGRSLAIERRFDLILVDLRLGPDDGLALLEELRRAPAPVIMMSGAWDPTSFSRAETLGAAAIWDKGAGFDVLLRMVGERLGEA